MANAAARQWAGVIDQLGQLEAALRNGNPLSSLETFYRSVSLINRRLYPRRVWKSLVTDKQVPFKLLSQCRQASGDMPLLSGACMHALSVFLWGTNTAGVLSTADINSTASSAASQPINHISLSIGRQLQQAGLFELLPSLITHTAEQLAAWQVTPEEVAALADDRQAPGTHCHTGLFKLYDNQLNGAMPVWRAGGPTLACVYCHMWGVLRSLGILQFLWSEHQFDSQLCPNLCLPLCQLFLGFMKHISLYLEQCTTNKQQPPQQLQFLVLIMKSTALSCIIPCWESLKLDETAENPMQQQQQLMVLQSPITLPIIGLMLVIAADAERLQLHFGSQLSTSPPSETQLSSGAATGQCSSQQGAADRTSISETLRLKLLLGGEERASMMWQFVCSHHDLLPITHDELLHAMSCSSRAVLWAAAVCSREEPHELHKQVRCLALNYLAVAKGKSQIVQQSLDNQTDLIDKLRRFLASKTQQHQEEQHQQQVDFQSSAVETGMHLWLPAVLLRWAADTTATASSPNSSSSSTVFIDACVTAGMCGLTESLAWARLEELKSRQGLYALLQQVVLLSSMQDQQDTVNPADHELSVSRCASLLSTIVDIHTANLDTEQDQLQEVLSIAVHLLPQLLRLCKARSRSVGTSHAQDSTSVSTNSSSRLQPSVRRPNCSSSNSCPPAAGVSGCHTITADEAFTAVLSYIWCLSDSIAGTREARLADQAKLLESLGAHSWSGKILASITEVKAAVTTAWSGYAIQLCSLLEDFVRLSAGRPLGSSLGHDDTGLVLLCSPFLDGCYWHAGGLLQAALTAGLLSSEASHLFSLRCSILKFGCSWEPNHNRAVDCVMGAALTAAIMLGKAASDSHCQQREEAAESATTTQSEGSCHELQCNSSSHGHASTDSRAPTPLADSAGATQPLETATDDDGTAAVTATAVAALPWLVLFGRCCLCWAQQLGQLASSGQEAGDSKQAVSGNISSSGILDLFLQPIGEDLIATSCLDSCAAFVNSSIVAAHLAAQGYPVKQMQQQLQQTQAAVTAMQAAAVRAGGVAPAEAISELRQQLHLLGLVLNTLAISSACNNPLCVNTAGPSEQDLVRGSSRTCGGCRVARYCSTRCQRQHWKQHKPVCKALAAKGSVLTAAD